MSKQQRRVDDLYRELVRKLALVRHGTITLVVQDGHVVQIDVTVKERFSTPFAVGALEARPEALEVS